MEQQQFIDRLVELRNQKGVSARDMSLSIGQSAGYINNIENGINYPSMSTFFYICDYLNVTPEEFFNINNTNPNRLATLVDKASSLNNEQLDLIIKIIDSIYIVFIIYNIFPWIVDIEFFFFFFFYI